DKGASGADPAKTKAELARLKGSWTVIAAEKGSMKIPEEFLKAIKVRFDGDKLKMEILGEIKEGTFRVDPTKTPATIDMTVEGKTSLGIYQLDKDALKLCAAEPGEPRPKEFKASDDKQLLATLKRGEKPAPEEECAQEGAQKAASATNLKIIGL